MKKFTKVLEDIVNLKRFVISTEIELIIEAENEGEAGYLADSILSGIEEQNSYTILNIAETDEVIKESKEEVLALWKKEFGDTKPSGDEKMEFYHKLRLKGFSGSLIFKQLIGKI